MPNKVVMDGTAEGYLTIFWDLFIVISCAPKHLKCEYHRYWNTTGSQIDVSHDYVRRVRKSLNLSFFGIYSALKLFLEASTSVLDK